MLSPELCGRREFVAEHRRRLERLRVGVEPVGARDALTEVKRETSKSFGFEWSEYGRFGWDDPVFDLDRERRVFLRKTISSEGDFAGRLVLDAGCGNGRYSHWAAQFGATVVGMDLSEAVESAYANTQGLDVHIIQGDVFRPPFSQDTFDLIFAIGVLMHTGHPYRATHSLAQRLRPGGTLTVNVYGTGNPVYELADRLLRRFTTKMDRRALGRFAARMAAVAEFCDRYHALNVVNAVIRLENHPHCIFDWYSAPVATHHVDREVVGWFEGCGLDVVAVESGREDSLNRWVGRLLGATAFRAGSSVRVQGRKPADGRTQLVQECTERADSSG
jgi:SAM-dependent methyltransferase